jgi:hypothetical protein
MEKRSPNTDKMSDWCRKLREDSAHLNWMGHMMRKSKIAQIESRFNRCWEDKLKEIFSNHTQKDVARILNLNPQTVVMWARHLNLRRQCIYCHKNLWAKTGNHHSACKIKYEHEQKLGLKGLLAKMAPALNINQLDLKKNKQTIVNSLRDKALTLPRRDYLIIEGRYLRRSSSRKTLQELGLEWGFTRERVRQIEVDAIKKLKKKSMRLITELMPIRPRESSPEIKYLKKEEWLRLIESVDSYRDKLIINLLYSTGMRVGELAKLKIKDIDFQERFIHIPAENTKTRTARTVTVAKEVLSDIRAYLKIAKIKRGRLFSVTVRRIQQIIKKYAAGAQISASLHTLRHTHILSTPF